MVKFRSLTSGLRGLAFALSAAAVLSAAAPGAFADPVPATTGALTPAEQKMAADLAAKVLSVIRGMPSTSSQTAFEGVILGVTTGKPCAIVKAAIGIVAGTSGLAPNAVSAAQQVAKACGPIGALGQTQNLETAPGFAGGGGVGSGPNYTP